MRKILFVCFTSEQAYTGGIQCTNRNYQSLVALFGIDNVERYVIRPYKNKKSILSILERVRDIFRGYMGGAKKSRAREIIRLLKDKKCTDLFVDSSLLGVLIPQIRKRCPKLRIYTFFHNFEYAFVKDSIRVNRDYIRFYWPILAYLNEKVACKYSDKIISLNRRDIDGICGRYGRTADIQIPITLSISYHPSKEVRSIPSARKYALFVGSYFFGNVQGIKWFCKNVLPLTDVHLTIVGAGMEQLKNDIIASEQIVIYNNVPDLTSYYENADFVVLPILSGSGMKVKTAESLMYGKYIIGTSEALRGYEVDENIAVQCDTVEAFVTAISRLKLSRKFNEPSRKLFEEKYSFEASLPLFKSVLTVK